MRLFIAIPLSDNLRSELTAVQSALQCRGVKGTFTPKENLHLTLAFIGEYPDPESVLETMETVDFKPFPLSLDGLGAFHQVWWAGIRENLVLNAYAKRLRHALAEAGIPYDRKGFSPHVTLVRKPVGRGEEAPGGLFFDGETMDVERVSLFRSDRGKKGMIYTELGTVEANPGGG